MIFALVLRTRLLLLETKILTPVWCGLQTQHSIQGNSCATIPSLLLGKCPNENSQAHILALHFWSHALSLCAWAASKFQTSCMGSLENSHCPRCPPCRDLKCSLPRNIFMDSFKFFKNYFIFSHK